MLSIEWHSVRFSTERSVHQLISSFCVTRLCHQTKYACTIFLFTTSSLFRLLHTRVTFRNCRTRTLKIPERHPFLSLLQLVSFFVYVSRALEPSKKLLATRVVISLLCKWFQMHFNNIKLTKASFNVRFRCKFLLTLLYLIYIYI